MMLAREVLVLECGYNRAFFLVVVGRGVAIGVTMILSLLILICG